MKPATIAEKKTGTMVDCIEITPEIVNAWELPEVQRGLVVNAKVRALTERLKQNGGVLPGILLLGVLDKHTYLVDGQQRRNAFLMSGLQVGYADVCYQWFSSMVALGEAFNEAQKHLVGLRSDDSLRALEPGHPLLQRIRKELPFVGYDRPRRSISTSILSMSVVIRLWRGSAQEIPVNASNLSTAETAESLTPEDTKNLVGFMQLAWVAWGRDPEYAMLWKSLNLILCMWIYRRMVLGESPGDSRAHMTRFTGEQFMRGLMAVSANKTYTEWLVGRMLGDHDRAPAYNRLKAIIGNRLKGEIKATKNGKGHDSVRFPFPAWGGVQRGGVRPEVVGIVKAAGN